ncbi:hypothetical protein [Salinarimonas ramus]|uniref:Formate dehydrogenase region TAT target n=1 Tax=Salinarimonas ramus TaxID=690164 RepID=A0A917V679_9HYPH|nr:hypothetical protein [Salinarimonas ramus]GGK45277.1 hypothetical protein GCM10011322_35560 [Salinarimonas ramus]
MAEREVDRKQGPERPERRTILRGLALAPAAAAAPVLGGAQEAQALTAPMDRRAPRYRETEHVLTFYRTNAR